MPFRSRVLAFAAAVTGSAASAQTPDIPELCMIPANAVGFAHVRLADLWKHEAMSEPRRVFERAGPKAIASLDRFTPAPSSIERVTAVAFLNPRASGRNPLDAIDPVVIARFSAPFDPAKVKAAHLPNGESKTILGKEVVVAGKQGFALAFVDDRTLMFGELNHVTSLLTPAKDMPNSPLAGAAKAAVGKHVFAAINVAALPIPPEAAEQVPEEYRALFQTKTITAGLTMKGAIDAEVRLTFGSDAAATSGEKSVRAGAKAARVLLDQQRRQIEGGLDKPIKQGDQISQFGESLAMVAALGGLNTADDILAELPLKRAGTDLIASATLPAWMTQYVGAAALAAGGLLPAVQKTRESAARAQSMNNMKQIALALHNYHDAHGTFPPAAICDKRGKKLLSWRVAILPYIEQDNIYKQFKLDEAWDGPNNKKWSDVAIKTYIDPRAPGKATETYYKVFVGNGALFDWVQGGKFTGVTDGTSNTLMTIAGGDPVPWAKPDDIEFDPKADVPDLAKPFAGDLLFGMADGSVRGVNMNAKKLTQETLKALITRSGGEVIAFDF